MKRHWLDRLVVVKKDTKKGLVLIGGLGEMGVGEMWFNEDERHAEYPGYAEAPDIDVPLTALSPLVLPTYLDKVKECEVPPCE